MFFIFESFLINKPKISLVYRLQSSGQYERAAAVALFNNKIRDAIEILSSQGSNDMKGTKGNILINTAFSYSLV